METRKLTFMAAAAFVGSMLVLTATAQARSQPPLVVEGRAHIDPDTQRIVKYGDLNLADPDGQQSLMRRVDYSINDLCQVNLFAFQHLEEVTATRTCVGAAWDSAKPQIATAFERAQSGASLGAAVLIISAQR